MEWKVKTDLPFEGITNEFEVGMSVALRVMMEDVHRFAEPTTPKRTGFLRGGVTKQMVGLDKAIIRWSENYAAAQEEGGRTDPRTGRYIQFVNYTTPGTGPHFVETSVNKVMNNIPYYLELGGIR